MAPAKTRRPAKLLTEVELELMTLLWREGGGTVADVLAVLSPDRRLAYTSVSTILRILEQKQVVTSEKIGRAHRYVPVIAKADYEAFALEQVVGKVFAGQPLALVRRLVDTKGLTRKDIAELRALLDEVQRPGGR